MHLDAKKSHSYSLSFKKAHQTCLKKALGTQNASNRARMLVALKKCCLYKKEEERRQAEGGVHLRFGTRDRALSCFLLSLNNIFEMCRV
jgi:hypothetical protein